MTTLQLINSTYGVKTKAWGPHFWKTMYFVAMNYPVSNPSQQDRKHYKSFYQSIQFILPCGLCLADFKKAVKEIPIDEYLDSRIDLLRWIWDMYDRVNCKLMAQEKKRFIEERNKLVQYYDEKRINKKQFDQRVEKIYQKICTTQKTTPFKQVLSEYAQHRARPK